MKTNIEFEMGFKSWEDGNLESNNPFTEGSTKYSDWLRGFRSAYYFWMK